MSKKQSAKELSGAYRFCGNGQGLPGLPHEVTREQAEELGLLDHLTAAIERGDYKPKATVSTPEKSEHSKGE